VWKATNFFCAYKRPIVFDLFLVLWAKARLLVALPTKARILVSFRGFFED
jgi:hypothetical protein